MSIKARCTHCNGNRQAPAISCPCCNHGDHIRPRNMVRREEIAIDMGIANTAANNRLEKLRGLSY